MRFYALHRKQASRFLPESIISTFFERFAIRLRIRRVDAIPPAGKLAFLMTIRTQSDPNSKKHPKTYDDLVWVQCKGFRCLAFTDANHKWINFYTGKKLADFVKVID
jgi:hypothetical protein